MWGRGSFDSHGRGDSDWRQRNHLHKGVPVSSDTMRDGRLGTMEGGPTHLVLDFTPPFWEDKFVLTLATMFVVTCCGTTCTKVGRNVKLKWEGIWSECLWPQPLMEESSFSHLCHCGFWRKGELSLGSLWGSGQLSQDSPLTGSWIIAWSPNLTVNLTFYLAYL